MKMQLAQTNQRHLFNIEIYSLLTILFDSFSQASRIEDLLPYNFKNHHRPKDVQIWALSAILPGSQLIFSKSSTHTRPDHLRGSPSYHWYWSFADL